MQRRGTSTLEWFIVALVLVWALASPLWRVLPLMIFVLVTCQLVPYAIAKKTGIRVQQFVFGIGPRLIEFEIGGVYYSFHVLPITSTLIFDSLRGWKDLLFRFSAVLAAIFLALVCLTFTFVRGGEIPAARVVLIQIAPNSAAARAGIQAGDVIDKVNGRPIVNTWELDEYIEKLDARTIQMDLIRGDTGFSLTVEVPVAQPIGWATRAEPWLEILELEPGSPADNAGLRVGDVLWTLDDKVVSNAFDFATHLTEKKNQELRIVVKRGAAVMSPMVLSPRANPAAGQKLFGMMLGRVFSIAEVSWQRAIRMGAIRTEEMIVTVIGVFVAPTPFSIHPLNIDYLRQRPIETAFMGLLSFYFSYFFVMSSLAVLGSMKSGCNIVSLLLAVIIASWLFAALNLSFFDPLRAITSGGMFGIGNILWFSV